MVRKRGFLGFSKGPERTEWGTHLKQVRDAQKTPTKRGIRWVLIRVAVAMPFVVLIGLLILEQAAFDPEPGGCWGVCGIGTGWGG